MIEYNKKDQDLKVTQAGTGQNDHFKKGDINIWCIIIIFFFII